MSDLAVKRFCRSAEKLRLRVPRPSEPYLWSAEGGEDKSAISSFCIIELNDIWAFFCRSLTLNLASGRARDLNGAIVYATNPCSEADALLKIANRRGHEPKWHSARETIAAIDKLIIPKGNQVKLSLSVLSSPAPDINITRNFVAHRRSDCSIKLMNAPFYRSDMKLDPFRICNYLRHDGRSIFDYWVEELSDIAISSVI